MRYLADLLALLPESPDVLELGSGAGIDSTRVLAERGRLTGVEISEAQIAVARERVPVLTRCCAKQATYAQACVGQPLTHRQRR